MKFVKTIVSAFALASMTSSVLAENTYGCYERLYPPTHFTGKQKNQTIDYISLELVANENPGVFILTFSFKGSERFFFSFGECMYGQDSSICIVKRNGGIPAGHFVLKRHRNKDSILIMTQLNEGASGSIHNIEFNGDKEPESYTWKPNKYDTEFRLFPATKCQLIIEMNESDQDDEN